MTRGTRLPSALLAAAAALALAGCSAAPTAPASEPARTPASPTVSASSATVHLDLGDAIPVGSRVTVVGDSIVRGYGVEAEDAWPALVGDTLGWSVANLGCDGGGFIEPGACGAPIGDRGEDIAETEPDVVVLVPSSNDLGWPVDEVTDLIPPSVDAIAEAVPDAHLLALGSVWGPDPRPTDLDAYDGALADAVTAAGGSVLEYPDPLRPEGLLSEDGVHPTEEGQAALAEAFVLAAEKAGLAEAVPTDQRATDAPD